MSWKTTLHEVVSPRVNLELAARDALESVRLGLGNEIGPTVNGCAGYVERPRDRGLIPIVVGEHIRFAHTANCTP